MRAISKIKHHSYIIGKKSANLSLFGVVGVGCGGPL